MSKLVLIRLALSGALVAVAVVELLGISGGTSGQLLAGGAGAAAVTVLKLTQVL